MCLVICLPGDVENVNSIFVVLFSSACVDTVFGCPPLTYPSSISLLAFSVGIVLEPYTSCLALVVMIRLLSTSVLTKIAEVADLATSSQLLLDVLVSAQVSRVVLQAWKGGFRAEWERKLGGGVWFDRVSLVASHRCRASVRLEALDLHALDFETISYLGAFLSGVYIQSE